MKSLVLYLCLFVSGCATSIHIPSYHYTDKVSYAGEPKVISVWISPDFDVFDRTHITDAIASWNGSLNGYVKLKISLEMPSDNDWVIVKVPAQDSTLPKVDARHGQYVLGAVDEIGGHNMFLARETMSSGDVYFVTLHEIGHLLGAEHLGNHLMYPHHDREKFHCIDKQTAMQISSYQKIPAENINYCQFY